jgi:2-phospho-L-lactate/phosphoenolpyruvate guanylyltransferase
MDLWAIIPVKTFGQGKSRLAAVLDDGERARLSRRMFLHVFRIAAEELGRVRVAVVSADRTLTAAADIAHLVHEAAPGNLNRALALAVRYAVRRGAGAIVVLPADLPELGRGDIAALREALDIPRSCAIAPDIDETGTNALAIRPPGPGLFRFGADSFAAHVQAAEARGYRVRIVRRSGLALDIDTPESYRTWLVREGASA